MEVWRDVPGYDGVYAVSNFGRVKRLAAACGARAGRVLRFGQMPDGRRNVNLCVQARPKSYMVHRLVAIAFIGEPPLPKCHVEHIDGNYSNNRLANLRWVSPSDTMYKQVERGTSKGMSYGRSGGLTEAQVIAIRADHRAERAVAKDFGISPATVGQIRRRETYQHFPARDGDYVPAQPRMRLTDDAVRAVRTDTRSPETIAAELGCTSSAVWAIRARTSYAYVPDAPANGPTPTPDTKSDAPLNRITLSGDTAYIALAKGKTAIIDAGDVPLVAPYRWAARKGKGTWYVMARMRDPDGRVWALPLHRLLLNPPDGLVVDHINTDGLDNRRANLRLATVAQNNLNSRVRKDCVSGLKGAFFDSRQNRYYSRIKTDEGAKWLGYFNTAEEAAEAYAKASVRYHGEFGRSYLDDA